MAEGKTAVTVWDVPAGKANSVLNKLGNELGAQGAEVLERLDKDVYFRSQVVEFLIGRHSCSHHRNIDLHIPD